MNTRKTVKCFMCLKTKNDQITNYTDYIITYNECLEQKWFCVLK